MNSFDPVFLDLTKAYTSIVSALHAVHKSPDKYGPFAEPLLNELLKSIESILKFY